MDTHPRTKASEEPKSHHQNKSSKGRSSTQRLSCLLFQMFCVETNSFLPNQQSDGRDLARQGEPRQVRFHFYQACVARGMKPHLARLTLARKIAAITLLVWKKGVRFDAEHLKQQAA